LWLSIVLLGSAAGYGQTVYYVAPHYNGARTTGSSATPWNVLNASAWSAINSALASSDVLIYFSARNASADTDDVYGAPSEIDLTKRTNTSGHRLTLDGRSWYNTSDTAPAWLPYMGPSKSRVRDFLSQNSSHTKYSNITIDGFRILTTGGNKAATICGDNWTLTNSDIAADSGAKDGPLILIIPTSDSAHEGSGSYCPVMTNVNITNNTIHDSFGELIYVGGGGCSRSDPHGGATCQGFPSHNLVTITGNKIYNGGTWGAQGDGIDIKGGLTNLTVSGNTIYDLKDPFANEVRAIVMQGTRDIDPAQHVVISGNYIHDIKAGDAAIVLANTWGTPKGVEIRNNVVAGSSKAGIQVYDGDAITIFNNTVFSNSTEGILTEAGTVIIDNNLLVANNRGRSQVSLAGTITSSFNGYSGTWMGTCRSCVSGLSSSDMVNPSGADFRLAPGSKARNAGTPVPSFNVDYVGTLRPQESAWDIGAYEFVPR
jgi:parallel beta-helix repeat protein